tara:strand:- start:1791 stop:1943 length:153 start_codon:yes stop_codon:yes gene_type:complete
VNLYKVEREHVGNLKKSTYYVVAENKKDAILRADTFLHRVLDIHFVEKIF